MIEGCGIIVVPNGIVTVEFSRAASTPATTSPARYAARKALMLMLSTASTAGRRFNGKMGEISYLMRLLAC